MPNKNNLIGDYSSYEKDVNRLASRRLLSGLKGIAKRNKGKISLAEALHNEKIHSIQKGNINLKGEKVMAGIDTGPMMKENKKKMMFGKKKYDEEDDNKKGKKKGLAAILAKLRKKQ